MSITLRSRLRTTLIWLVPSSLRSSSYHGDTYHYLSPSTLRPSPTNIHTRRTSQFQSVATHGMHIHLNVRTFNSDSWQGPERANRTGIPPPSSPLIDLTPLPTPSLHCPTAFRIPCKVHAVSSPSPLSLSLICAVLFPFVSHLPPHNRCTDPRLPRVDLVRPFLFLCPIPPYLRYPPPASLRMISLLLSCFLISSRQ